jgi:hypothetical protein
MSLWYIGEEFDFMLYYSGLIPYDGLLQTETLRNILFNIIIIPKEQVCIFCWFNVENYIRCMVLQCAIFPCQFSRILGHDSQCSQNDCF